MSHFTTLVVLDKSVPACGVNLKLAKVLAKWDENIRIPEYRVYIEGSPETHWSYEAVMTDTTQDHRDGWDQPVRKVPLNAGFLDHRSRVLRELGATGAAPVTWEEFVMLSNMRWEYTQEPAANLPATGEESDDPEENDPDHYNRMYYDAETGRAYELSTYNPESKWDWWTIGGRWSDYFPVNPEAAQDDIIDHHFLTLTNARCNGGRKYALHLDKMLTDAIDTAQGEYDLWEKMLAEHGPAKGWSHFADLMGQIPQPERGDEESLVAFRTAQNEVRKQYREQPLVKAFEKLDEESSRWVFDCPVDYFNTDREHFVERKRNAAVPGFALVTKEGQWAAPGEMGWWAMSSDTEGSREAYHAVANQYIADGVHEQDWLILLDLHI